MKSPTTLIVCALLLSTQLFKAQSTVTSEILGHTYSMDFNKDKNEFTMCNETNEGSSNCIKKTIQNENQFQILNALSKAVDAQVATYTFSIFEQDKLLSDFKDLDYSAVKLNVDLVKLKSATSPVPFKIENAPDDFPSFTIKKDSTSYTLSSEPSVFSSPVTLTFTEDILDKADDFKNAIRAELVKIKVELATFYVPKVEAKFDTMLQELYNTHIIQSEQSQLIKSIDEAADQYSGILILNKEIDYKVTYPVEKDKLKKDQSVDYLSGLTNQSNASPSKKRSNYKIITIKGRGKLKLNNALVHFFNNKASSIYIEGELEFNNKKEKLIFINNQFSVPIRFFNMYGSSVSAELGLTLNGERVKITIEFNDVFDYKSNQFFNYSVANDQVTLSNLVAGKNMAKVVQRRFFDFFTGIVYTDVLGFNTENSNSILNAQAKLLIPMNLLNWGKVSATRQFTTTANIALNNSFEDETRYISIKDDETFNHFDLMRKNNLYGKLGLDLVTYESKGWFLNTSLGYNLGFYRTGFRYTQTIENAEDIVTNTQLLSVAHGPFINFEIRPQTNFGADITFSLEDLNYNGMNSINDREFRNNIITDSGTNHFLVKYNLFNIEANFYWLTSPEKKSNGGIYAKLGAYYHTESYDIFPQLMVGYATNLSSFVNRFKPTTKESK